MSQSNRINGGLIDRDQTLQFSFNGKNMQGHPGDTLASALLANDVRLMGRSATATPTGSVRAGARSSVFGLSS